jgi:hypothetical protein
MLKEAARFESDVVSSNTRFWPRLVLSLTLFFGIIVVAVYLFSGTEIPFSGANESGISVVEANTPSPEEAQIMVNEEQIVVNDAEIVEIPITTSVADATVQTEIAVVPEKYLLEVLTMKTSWLKIIVDNQDPKEFSLKPGDHLEFEAVSGFNLLVGNAVGLQLTLNGNPVHVSGKSGQVVTVQLP